MFLICCIDGESPSCNAHLCFFSTCTQTFWHSSAHVLGLAMEEYYGGSLCYGPPIENGFFYDMEMPSGLAASQEDFEKLEAIANRAIKSKLPFQRLVVKREDLLRLFKVEEKKAKPDGKTRERKKSRKCVDQGEGKERFKAAKTLDLYEWNRTLWG